MKPKNKELAIARPELAIHVAEPGTRTRRGFLRCEIGEHVSFSTESLESYFFARWEPLAYDALLVAAAAEFADRTQRRPAHAWEREFHLAIPVHDPDQWNDRRVADTLHDVLNFLTGDRWRFEFYKRSAPASQPQQGLLAINAGVEAVIPFSNGLDSRAVAGLMTRDLGDKLVRIRLGARVQDGEGLSHQREAFTSVPHKVKSGEQRFVESTVRSRGFKFALISSLAAFLANARQIVVPESGQGALGPALVPVGHAYEDFRSHPLFTGRMEKFVKALLGIEVRFVFPRLWYTKAETLKAFVDGCDQPASWSGTWSCWQQNRQVSVNHKKRHCGICAACLLRRLSVHAAGLEESKDRYVWDDLSARSFFEGAAASFPSQKITLALREYAIAGTLHLDHLAGLLTSSVNACMVDLTTFQLSDTLAIPQAEIRSKLVRMLKQHSLEWTNFIQALGQHSFIADWAVSARS
jgi:7-cyano-7-deazaguanine synthase in queuosine biosynthesis